MAKFKRWTNEEDTVLVQAIKANLHNRSQAFREAAAKLEDRDETSCSNRWYIVLGNPEHKKYVGCMFTMVGAKSKLDNRTSSREGVHITPTKTKKGLWAKIKTLLGL